ncbi:MAG TPA: BrnT family toxin, partial [Vicinamibacteria bacterium]
MIEFEWDPEKARKDLKKHGVPFSEATTVFRDPTAITIYDPDHSHDEDRYITTG